MVRTDDRGYDREAAAAAGEQWGCDPSRATGRQRRHAPEGEGREPPRTAKEPMAAQGRPPAGRALEARRPVIVEPVLGQSKEGRGVRRCLLRGLAHLRGAWPLVGLTQTLLKLWRYTCAPITA